MGRSLLSLLGRGRGALPSAPAAGTAIDWAAGIRATWEFGEPGAQAALRQFLEEGIQHFETRSDAKTLQSQGCVGPAVGWGGVGWGLGRSTWRATARRPATGCGAKP
jgi:deoxyribodipyrimidine photolyase